MHIVLLIRVLRCTCNPALWLQLVLINKLLNYYYYNTRAGENFAEVNMLMLAPTGKAVIVKKSSPKNLSADCRSTVGRQLADSWSSVGRQLADCRLLGFARNIGYLSANSRPTVARQSADCW